MHLRVPAAVVRPAALFLCLLAFSARQPACAEDAYPEPDLKKEIFKVSELSLDEAGRARTATLLGLLVRNFNPPGTDKVKRRHARMLGIALRLDPENKIAFVANTRLSRDEIPMPVSDVPETLATITDEIYKSAARLKGTGKPDDLKLAGYLFAVLVDVRPDSDDFVFEEAKLRKAGPALDWSWVPGLEASAPGSPDASGRPRSPESELARTQATIKGLVVNVLDTGDMVGQAMEITATAAPAGAAVPAPTYPYPAIPSTLGAAALPHVIRLRGTAGEQMMIALGEACRTAQQRYPHWQRRAVEISFGDKYSAKDGGSAGAAFTVLLLSLLDGFEIDPKCAMTGDVTVTGSVTRVGGIPDKIRAAAQAGCEVVVVPAENKPHINDLIVLYPKNMLWSIQILSAATLDEAVAAARRDRQGDVGKAVALFAEFQKTAQARNDVEFLRTAAAKSQLKEILQLCPNHVSAEYLLLVAEDKHLNHLTLGTSLTQLFAACHKIQPLIWAGGVPANLREYLTDKSVESARSRMNALKSKLHRDVKPLQPLLLDFLGATDALADHSSTLKQARSLARADPVRTQQYEKAYLESRQTLRAKMEEIGTDKSVMEKLLTGLDPSEKQRPAPSPAAAPPSTTPPAMTKPPDSPAKPPAPPAAEDPEKLGLRHLLLAKNFLNQNNLAKAEENAKKALELCPTGKIAEEARDVLKSVEALK
jgi:hypothetical protein